MVNHEHCDLVMYQYLHNNSYELQSFWGIERMI
jgi:hypothetical protein